MMQTVAEAAWCADLRYQGHARLIGCGVVQTEVGMALVDPGPEITLDTLESALKGFCGGFENVHCLLLTHIHLDHAGATGAIVARYPHVQVYAHARGAQHIVRPERLLASVRRIYGEEMEATWGSLSPTPAANVHALEGDEVLRIGGRSFEVAYTPGHANHHVCYLDIATGTAFVGDTAGMRITNTPYIVPVALPPDIHVERWRESLGRLKDWAPDRLFLTHYGPSEDVAWHLDNTERRLDDWAAQVRSSLFAKMDDPARAQRFHDSEMAAVRAALSDTDRAPYALMGQPKASWYGLARYWRTVAGLGEA